jgi:two-component system chemotaxis sensor kinase CheA
MDRFDDAFFREAKSGIRALNDGLLAVENDDEVSIDELFRVAHSLKGSCRTHGLSEAGELAHALEDVLGALRSEEVDPTAALIDEALAVVDCLEALVRARADGDSFERDVDASLESLRSTLDEQRAESASGDATDEGRSLEPTGDDEWDPADSKLSDDVVAALEETTEFDDLDGLLDDDGGASDGDLDGWGLLHEDETADDEETETTPDGANRQDGKKEPDTQEETETRDEAETPDDPSAFFAETKSDLDEADAVDSLQEDIDAVEFGEFDEDDNYTIDELLELDPDESPPQDGGGAFEEREDATGIDEEEAEIDESEADSTFEEETEKGVDEDGITEEEPPDSAATLDISPANRPSPDSSAESAESDAVIESDEATASTSVEESVEENAANEFVFGDPQEDDSDSHGVDADDEPVASDGQAGKAASDDEGSNLDDQTSGFDESEMEATPDDVPDLDSVPDSVPDADLDVELSGELDVDSDDWADDADDEWAGDSEMDVSVDEGMAEFESRFGDLLGGGPGAEAAGDGPTFRAAVSTIEESRLDADEFPTATTTQETEGPGEFDRLQEMTVDVETADQLLNVAEELSLTHLRLDEAVGPETDEAISEEVSNLLRVVTEYRRTVMDVRLVPLRTAIESIPRTVRDVARSQDKEVELVVEDVDVELDRGIIDELRDPLVHVARNAVDHGIEPREDRVAAGKPPEGTIEIRAERVGSTVVIEVSDDGGGIDPDAVRQRAVDTGVLTRKEASRLDDEAVYDLLFEPGFTTREEVTDVSGRGVGMDVVSRTVAELDGSVTVDSDPGDGTTVRLTVPVSIVFTEVLFVEANGETFGIPMSVVEQITATPPIRTNDDREVVRRSDLDVVGGLPDDGNVDDREVDGEVVDDGNVDDREGDDREGEGRERDDGNVDDEEAEDSYPLIRLESALDLRDGTGGDDGQVVWVRDEDELLAIRCDRVVTSREVVVRPYGDLLRDVPGVSGATTLGDGEAVNVLDVRSI